MVYCGPDIAVRVNYSYRKRSVEPSIPQPASAHDELPLLQMARHLGKSQPAEERIVISVPSRHTHIRQSSETPHHNRRDILPLFPHNVSEIIYGCAQPNVRNTTSPHDLLFQQLGIAQEGIPAVSLVLDQSCHEGHKDGNSRPAAIRWTKTSF